MARYIDAYKFEKEIEEIISVRNAVINGKEFPVFLADHTFHAIRNYPPADVVEVKHGKWIVPSGGIKIFEDRYVICSECNVMIPVVKELDRYWYCPNCGAKMDGGEKKNDS